MSSCNIDHTNADTRNKLESQKEFLPDHMYNEASDFLNNRPSQHKLNELFHLLKKYDLTEKEERLARNKKLKQLTGIPE
ncbi:hypothetical protein [Halobacillus andaensis]|uniref:hypothetical protein n=1 Tax=Halobacillus andaensis TaxID=1176239 RepID=UPI003D70F236